MCHFLVSFVVCDAKHIAIVISTSSKIILFSFVCAGDVLLLLVMWHVSSNEVA